MSPLGQRRVLRVKNVSKEECRLDGEELGDLILPKEEVPLGTMVGDAMEVVILSGSRGEWTASMNLPIACVGEFAFLKVMDLNPRVGAYLDWGHGRELFLPRREVPEGTRVGYSLVVGVIADPATAQISATTRIEPLMNREPPPYIEGQRVRVLVASATPLGFKAIVENTHWGLLYKSNLGSVLRQGSELDAYVKCVRPDGKLDLILDPPGYDRVRPLADQILKAVRDSGGRLNMSDNSSPEEIRNKFGVSKKAFKQALGKLYRERRLNLGDGWIEAARLWILLSALLFLLSPRMHAARVDYTREVRPLLADACLRCHGQDAAARKGNLRLDLRESATHPAKSGAIAIVPGNPDTSELVRRLSTSDSDARMPPIDSHKQVSEAQQAMLRRWIAEGAEYRGHWAFEPPRRPDIPLVGGKGAGWNRYNAVDAFVQVGLLEKSLEPSKEATRTVLARRLALDLTGLPPSLEDVRGFVADSSPGAYERWVERLLRSPRYGEKMATDWLDVARYADSNGYQVDRDREMWAWRDWVVGAFNRNLPFDQFTVEQIAGDLLPEARLDQRIATGYHRNHMINEEGGIIAEEFLAEYCSDRVETTAMAWLGLTFNCARCHDHKYDPFTQRDYYSLYAFFHNIDEKGVGDYGAPYRRSTPPFLKLPPPETEARLQRLARELDLANGALNEAKAVIASGMEAWETRAGTGTIEWREGAFLRAGITLTNGVVGNHSSGLEVNLPRDGKATISMDIRVPQGEISAIRLEWIPVGTTANGPTNALLAVREIRVRQLDASAETPWIDLRASTTVGVAKAEEVSRATDRKTETAWKLGRGLVTPQAGILQLSGVRRGLGQVLLHLELDLAVEGDSSSNAWTLRIAGTSAEPDLFLPPELAEILKRGVTGRVEADRKKLEAFRWAESANIRELQNKVDALTREQREVDLATPVTLVMSELSTPRETRVHIRGAYDRLGDRVQATTPASLPAMPEGWPKNRLGLARWLVDRGNPLTARVFVNRVWQSLFGAGLVRTPEDFGVQGEYPTHPELLDWLACEFMDSGWDVQALIRLLVTSATYRQDSAFRERGAKVDPENRWLSRGARGRLSAEAIRDQALAVSGLLVGQLGGPAVRPYHPPGLYEQVVAGSSADTYVQDHGSSLYRRTLYTYWKRSVPNPALLLFDRPFRETCAVRRSRTSTPLQALNILNDPTYVEAARRLGWRMLQEGGDSVETRIQHGFQWTVGRLPEPEEARILIRGWKRASEGYRADTTSAAALVAVGESKVPEHVDRAELAAYTITASTLLNLDETLNKE